MKETKIIVPFEFKQLDEMSDFFVFRGLASTFGNVDEGNEIVVANSFDQSLVNIRRNAVDIPGLQGKQKLLPVLWVHQLDEPIGSFTVINITAEGLEVEGILPKSDTFVMGRVIPQIQVRSVGHMSIGFMSDKRSRNSDGVTLLEVNDLKEISLTPLAENTLAVIREFKSRNPMSELTIAEANTPWNHDEALQRVKEFTEAESDPNDRFAKAFLHVDSDDPEDFDSYSFFFADIIDDEMKAIPNGIMSAAVQFHANKEINDEVVKNEIIGYYKKLGLDSPFVKKMCFRVDNIDAMIVSDVRTVEKVLKSGFMLPGKNAKTLISMVKKSSMRDADEVVRRDAKQFEPLFDRINQTLRKFDSGHTKD